MTQIRFLLAGLLAVSAVLTPAMGALQSQPDTSNSAQAVPPIKKAAAKHGNTEQSEGERIFAQNCSRCHYAPEGFSPRISGTVVRHMRVRASLSEHDEKELLKFFNP